MLNIKLLKMYIILKRKKGGNFLPQAAHKTAADDGGTAEVFALLENGKGQKKAS